MPPPNTTFATAIDLGTTLPVTVNQTVNDGATTYTVWYKYTAQPSDKYLGGFGFGGAVGSGYRPTCFVWLDDEVTQWPGQFGIDFGNGAFIKPFQMPVVPGTTYYFQFVKNGDFNPSELEFNLQRAPDVTVPEGSILVPDDSPGFGAVFLSSEDADDDNVLAFHYPGLDSCEFGDVLAASKRYLLEDKTSGDSELVLYSSAFVELDRIPFSNGAGFEVIIRANQATNIFWIAQRSFITQTLITSVDADGVQGAVITLSSPGCTALVGNNDSTLIYLGVAISTSAIKVWNIAGNAFDSDLAASVANYGIRDMLMVGDDLLVLYYKDSSTRDLMARLVNASTGATISQFDIHNGNDLVTLAQIRVGYRLAYALDDPDSFWVWYHLTTDGSGGNLSDGLSRFQNIRISDGAVLASIDYIEFQGGLYQPAATDTPLARFGNSQSCPFIITRLAIEPEPGVSGGIYKIVTGKRNDTLWVDVAEETTEDVKIPDPTIQTGLLGG